MSAVDPSTAGIEVGEPDGLWFRVRARAAGIEHADLSRISPAGVAQFSPASPLYGPRASQQPVALST